MAKKIIESLTPEQLAVIPDYVARWKAIGQNCDPCDFEAAKPFVYEAYKVANIKQGPRNIIRAKSPWSAAVIAAMFLRMSEAEIDSWCETPTKAQDELFPTFDPVDCSFTANGKKMTAERGELRSAVTAQIHGPHDTGWLAPYEFCSKELGLVEEFAPIQPWIDLAKVGGWWAPYDSVCILQDRHIAIHFDDQGRVSCNNAMAIEYSDGFGAWVIDGLNVDEQIVMKPETQTLEQLEAQQSADLREIRIRQYGWPRYLAATNAKLLNNGTNDIEGTEEALYLLKDGSKRLLGSCRTGRVFAMSVHEDVETCEQARRWLSPVGGVNVVNRS